MKKLIFLPMFFALVCSVSAQEFANPKWEYLEVLDYMGHSLTKKKRIEVIYDETYRSWGKGGNVLEDSTGQTLKFKTHVEALNYLGAQGWETILSYIEDVQGVGKQIHFLMRRRYE